MKRSGKNVNFGVVTVSTGYDAAAVTVVLNSGDGAKLAFPMYVSWFDGTKYSSPAQDPNREIVQITNIVGDTLTVVRGVLGTSASTKNTSNSTYKMANTPFAHVIPDTIIKDADGTAVNNSMTLVSDPDLQFAIGANEVWEVEVFVAWKSATADLKFDFSGPAAPTAVMISSTKEFYPGSDKVATAFSSGLLSASNSSHASGDGFTVFASIINGANAGTVAFQIAQWAAVVEDTKLLKGTRMRVRRVA